MDDDGALSPGAADAQRVLGARRHRGQRTADGEQAVVLAKETSPDVVVMDIKMPVRDGIDAALLQGLEQAAMAEGAMVEIVAPRVGGVEAADGTLIPAKQMIDGGPSVLYDAVAIIVSPEGAAPTPAKP